MHIRALVILVVFALTVLLITGQGGFYLLKSVLSDSHFRIAVAGNASRIFDGQSGIDVFMGDSRIMGGINTEIINSGGNKRAYNLAYNGMTLDDVMLTFGLFSRTCGCKISRVFVNANSLPVLSDVRDSNTTDFEIFLSAYDRTLLDKIRKHNPVLGYSLQLFPLLHFNNELFLRAMYYRFISGNDQLYKNSYSLSVTPSFIERLKKRKQASDIDRESVVRFNRYISQTGAKLVIIIPPFHPRYIDHVTGFREFTEAITMTGSDLSVSVYDHSALLYSYPELFADPLHINGDGQIKYTNMLKAILY